MGDARLHPLALKLPAPPNDVNTDPNSNKNVSEHAHDHERGHSHSDSHSSSNSNSNSNSNRNNHNHSHSHSSDDGHHNEHAHSEHAHANEHQHRSHHAHDGDGHAHAHAHAHGHGNAHSAHAHSDHSVNIPILSPTTSSASSSSSSSASSNSNLNNCKGLNKKNHNAGSSAARTKLTYAVVLCAIFMFGELIGGYYANSLSIMTDAAHLLSDVAGMGISLFALVLLLQHFYLPFIAQRAQHSTDGSTAHYYMRHRRQTYLSGIPPTSKHSFGFHRAEILGALVSVALIWLMTGLLLYEAVSRFIEPEDVDGKLMFIVASCGLGINILMGLVLHQSGHGHAHGALTGGQPNAPCTGHGHAHGEKEEASTELHGHGHGHGAHGHGAHAHAEHGAGSHLLENDHLPQSSANATERKHCDSDELSHAGHSHGHAHGHTVNGHADDEVDVDDGVGHSVEPNSLLLSTLSTLRPGFGGLKKQINKKSPTGSNSSDSEAMYTPVNDAPVHAHAHAHAHGSGTAAAAKHGDSHENMNVKAAFIHVLGDGIQSLGVMLAAGLIWYNPHWHWADPLITFLFSFLVLLTTTRLIKQCASILMEGVPDGISLSDLERALTNITGVSAVRDLHVWSLTVGKVALSVHILCKDHVKPTHVLKQAHVLCAQKYHIHHTTIQVEHENEQVDCQLCPEYGVGV